MKNAMLSVAVNFCAEILKQVARELNGGLHIPKVPHTPLSSLATLGQAPTSTRSRKSPATKLGTLGCAIKGCTRPQRAKGYCSAHGQKRYLLEKTGRKPATWKDYAAPGSVLDIVLPRGRAGSKALADLAQK